MKHSIAYIPLDQQFLNNSNKKSRTEALNLTFNKNDAGMSCNSSMQKTMLMFENGAIYTENALELKEQ